MKFKKNKPASLPKSKQIAHPSQHKSKNKPSKIDKFEQEQHLPHEEQGQENNDQQEITWNLNQEPDSDPEEEQEERGDDGVGEVGEQEGEKEDDGEVEREDVEEDIMVNNQKNLEEYQEQIGNRGVVYMSRIPPYMTPNFIRKLLQAYDVERIYLLAESQWARNNRIKNKGSKRICFREGWIEFADKRVAKAAALTLNGQKMVHKKGSFYSEDIWNLKYLPKFKWHHLTQKLAHQQRMKKQRLRLEMQQQRKLQQHYTTQVHKSKLIGGIIRSKLAKGKQLKNENRRTFGQRAALKQEGDLQN